MTDLEGRVIYSSPRVLELFGFKSIKETIELNAFDFFAPEDRKKAMMHLQKTLKDGVVRKVEYTLVKKDGTRFIGELSAALIRDASRKPKAFIATTRDITERKRAEDEIKEYSEKLEEKVKEKTKELIKSHKKLVIAERLAAIGEVATQVGHDLRNPLTSIKGAAYYLKTDKNITLDKNAKKMLDTIDDSIAYSDKIITDLLDFSQEIKLKPVRKNVKEIVTDALSSIKVPRKVNVIDSTESEPTIHVDPLLIRRVLHNIFINAFDAMPDGGTLKIESKKNGENISIVICDSGIGIPKKVIEKLFVPFFTTKSRGVGLGLAICKRIVEAHGGSISVESKEGKGTCVTIILPKNKINRVQNK
jgi:PAS domain S-box-containing protein